jgi:hypothetical protein
MRPCPRCEADALAALTPERVAALAAAVPVSPALRADDACCRARLIRCGICDALREQVLCGHCGCFVQFRARGRNSFCPHPAGDQWVKSAYPGTSHEVL